MKFMSIREFRNQPIQKAIADERQIVLTAKSQPIAIVSAVDPETLDDELMALRRARAQVALDRIRAKVKEAGADALSMKDIDSEIADARRERRTRE